MTNRVDIRDFIVSIENKFPVNDWEIYNIKIWPIIRIRLFFYLISKLETKPQQISNYKDLIINSKISFRTRVLNFIKYGLKARIINKLGILYYYYWLNTLPKKKYLFLGGAAHRVTYEKAFYNRYFDRYIEDNNIVNESMYFEYDNKLNGQYKNPKQIYRYYIALEKFSKHYHKESDILIADFIGENSFSNFLEFLQENEYTREFSTKYSINDVKRIFYSIYINSMFFDKVIKKIAPKQVFILCYYSYDAVMSLIHVANKLNIQTIEMQHGSQTNIHLAYGSWSKIPQNGYSLMPTNYWCWDEDSANVLNSWIKNTTNLSVKVVGNYWINLWMSKETTYLHINYILYTLQPAPITIEELFSENIIKIIKNQKYKWYIRLHPRQYQSLPEIEAYLRYHKILDFVNIEDATNDSLPLLIKNCLIHVTNFSTTVVEASFFNKYSILFSPTGRDYYPELIERGIAKYIDTKDENFEQKFLQFVKNKEL